MRKTFDENEHFGAVTWTLNLKTIPTLDLIVRYTLSYTLCTLRLKSLALGVINYYILQRTHWNWDSTIFFVKKQLKNWLEYAESVQCCLQC